MRAKGLGFRKIARIAGLSRATVHSWIRRGTFPERAERMQRHSLLDIWAVRIDALHAQGLLKAVDILDALREEGYCGSYTLIKKYCRNAWKHGKEKLPKIPSIPKHWRSPRTLTWLLLNENRCTDGRDQHFLKLLYHGDTELQSAVNAARKFVVLIRTKGDEQLPVWIEHSKSTLLSSFAKSIERDRACVAAAMREPWSQGCVEGNVNRLKVIKRQMYGRGKFDLLRRRVLMKA